MSDTTPVPPRPPRPRPRTDLLTPSLLRRFDDAGKWSRRTGIGMIVVGLLVGLSALVSLFGSAPTEIALLQLAAAVTYGVPAVFLFAYGQRVNRALDEEPSINIELALPDASRFWIALTTCFVIFLGAEIFTIAVPAVKNSIRYSRLKSTAASMVPVRDALEAYALRNHSYPSAATYSYLLKALQPYGTNFPRADAWGTEFHYEAACKGKYCIAYSLRSAGADLRFSNTNSQRTVLTPLSHGDSDVIIADGRFTSAPKEWIDQ